MYCISNHVEKGSLATGSPLCLGFDEIYRRFPLPPLVVSEPGVAFVKTNFRSCEVGCVGEEDDGRGERENKGVGDRLGALTLPGVTAGRPVCLPLGPCWPPPCT